jgi:hypothetical protein
VSPSTCAFVSPCGLADLLVLAVTLTRFYLSKLDDFDSLPPALSALIILSKLPTFDDDAAVEVYRA